MKPSELKINDTIAVEQKIYANATDGKRHAPQWAATKFLAGEIVAITEKAVKIKNVWLPKQALTFVNFCKSANGDIPTFSVAKWATIPTDYIL